MSVIGDWPCLPSILQYKADVVSVYAPLYPYLSLSSSAMSTPTSSRLASVIMMNDDKGKRLSNQNRSWIPGLFL